MIALMPLTVPNEGPVTLAALRNYLRIDSTDDNTTLQSILLAARLAIEQKCNRILSVQTWRLRLDTWPDGQLVRVPLAPFRRFVAGRIFDEKGVSTTLTPASIVLSEPGFIGFSSAPQPRLREGGIELDIEVGYASATDVPAALTLAVLRKAALLYEMRGDEDHAADDKALDSLLAPFMPRRLA